jgi:hypothetical protein
MINGMKVIYSPGTEMETNPAEEGEAIENHVKAAFVGNAGPAIWEVLRCMIDELVEM